MGHMFNKALVAVALLAGLAAPVAANNDHITFTLYNNSPDRISATAGGMQCIEDGTTYGTERLSSGNHMLFTIKTEYDSADCNPMWSGDSIIVYTFRDDDGNIIGQLEWKNPDGKFDETYISGDDPWYLHHFDCYAQIYSEQVSSCDMDNSHHTTGSTLTFE